MSFVSRTWLAGSDLGGPALPFHAPMVRPKPCPTWSNFHQICFMLELKGMARSVANLSLRWNSTKVFSSKKLKVNCWIFVLSSSGSQCWHNVADFAWWNAQLGTNSILPKSAETEQAWMFLSMQSCWWTLSFQLCSFVAIFFRHPAAGFLVCPSFVAILFLGTL